MRFLALAIVALAALTAVHAARPFSDNEYEFMFSNFVAQYNKKYENPTEFFRRFEIFKDNMDYIHRHGAKNATYTLKMNEFGDLSSEEFGAKYLHYTPRLGAGSCWNSDNAPHKKIVTAPTSVNWVSKGVVTPVKNQGQCGSCWAFSTTGSVESYHAITTGQLVSLSEQELVDCGGSTGNEGCDGGEMQAAFEWIVQNGGICSESSYPYQGVDGNCQSSSCSNVVSINGCYNVDTNSEPALTNAIVNQPISVAVDAGGLDWQFYSGGIVNDPNCGTQLDHGVLAVGYGTDSGQGYFLVKNSWGASWGESGYIRLGRGTSTSTPGICGICMDASYPSNN